MSPRPAEWLPDSTGRHELRYWNGARWTEHVSDAGTQSVDPLDDSPSEAQAPDAFAFSMNPSDTVVVWQGEKRNLQAAASGGRLVSARYRMTRDAMHFEAGLISTRAEMIPLWTIMDVDLNQSMTQRARGVGDVLLQLDPANAKFGQTIVRLESVEDPRSVRDIVLKQANAARRAVLDFMHERDVEKRKAGASNVNVGTSTPAEPAQPPTQSSDSDLITFLRELGELRDSGVLTEEEFQAQKAKRLNAD